MTLFAIVTWIAVAILGPGATAVFIWFLLDLKNIFTEDTHQD